MRHFRFLLAAFALMLTTSTFANFNSDFEARKGSITYEIGKMLRGSDLTIEENFTVTVIFKVTEDKKIAIQRVSSPNEEVNQFLIKRLSDQKLYGDAWDSSKVYELPVKVESR